MAQDMRALVIGGSGFVGASLVAGLTERGIKVRVFRRRSSSLEALAGLEYEPVVGDILDGPDALVEAMADCEWVFHTAAVTQYWRRSQEGLYRVNVEGTRNVLTAALGAGVKRLVFTSSLGAMGLPANGNTLDESCHFNLKPEEFPYGHSKYLAEKEVYRATAQGLQAVIVNPSVIIGPRDVNRLGGSIILAAAKGRMLVTLPGGTNFVAIEDVVAGHIAAAERGRVAERYILAGENLSYRLVAVVVCETVGRRAPFVVLPSWSLPAAAAVVAVARAVLGDRVPIAPSQIRMSGAAIYANGEKALRELGLPQTPFRSAVEHAYDWYREHGYIRQTKR
jgi:dihydroflavonol-4-reductase